MSRFVGRPSDFKVYPPGVTPPPFDLLAQDPEEESETP